MMAVNVPRIFATAWDSFLVHLEVSKAAFERGRTLEGAFSGLQIALLSMPALGVALSGGRAGKRALTSAWAWSAGQPLRRTGVVLAAAATASLLGYIWFPNGDGRPVQPGERGTTQGGVEQLRRLPGGRPGPTSERAEELGNAPFMRFRHPRFNERCRCVRRRYALVLTRLPQMSIVHHAPDRFFEWS
jgi:hypothetical protein